MPENNQPEHRCLMCGAALSGPPRQQYCKDCAHVRHLACARDYAARKSKESNPTGQRKRSSGTKSQHPGPRKSSSGTTGVYLTTSGTSWFANIRVEGKLLPLGFSTNKEWCVAIRHEAEEHLKSGDFLDWYPTRPEPPVLNKAGARGVSHLQNKYQATIIITAKLFYLGLYDTIDEASSVRLLAEKHKKDGDFNTWFRKFTNSRKSKNKEIDGVNHKLCPVCGVYFPCPESDKTICCSKNCSHIRKAESHIGTSNKWSEAARAAARERDNSENLKSGTASAQQSPIAGRFETNRNAKIWTLVDPLGKEYTVRNLLLWARENTSEFDFPPGDKSARNIRAGFTAVARTLEGKRGKNRPATTYKGWTLKCPPEWPPQ